MEGTTKCGTSCKGTTSTTNVVLFVVLQANKTFNFFRQLMIWQLTSELLQWARQEKEPLVTSSDLKRSVTHKANMNPTYLPLEVSKNI